MLLHCNSLASQQIHSVQSVCGLRFSLIVSSRLCFSASYSQHSSFPLWRRFDFQSLHTPRCQRKGTKTGRFWFVKETWGIHRMGNTSTRIGAKRLFQKATLYHLGDLLLFFQTTLALRRERWPQPRRARPRLIMRRWGSRRRELF